jgi:cytochrome c
MDDRFNTIAGWVLFAGIVALGSSIVAGETFKSERPEEMGYPIEGVVQEGEGGAEAEKPIAFYLASADAAAGEQVFKKCTACHNADKGGANALGPNLYGVLGEGIGKGHAGFAFSPALSGVGGTWTWDTMSAWLASPKKFAPGTKMTFAGLSNPQDRANVMAFLNSRSDSPQPLPAAPAEAAAAPAGEAPAGAAPAASDKADASKPGTGTQPGPQKAEDEPATAKKPGGGEAADPAH